MSSTWTKILEEYNAERIVQGPMAPWARVLSRKIAAVKAETNRPLMIYGTACTSSGRQLSPAQLHIDPSDKIGFHDLLEGLDGPNLDIIIHSPGGFPEAAETIIDEIRDKFNNVRFIVPAYAKSAATMMVMAGDEILMDEAAELGPIDPQMLTPSGISPAEAVKEQFLKASEEIMKDPQRLSIWLPILQPMGPALLVQCDNAIELSKTLVREWLTKYMFRGNAAGPAKADLVANYLGSHANWKSHARRVRLEHLKKPEYSLNIKNLREHPNLYSKVWELYCMVDIIFANTPIYKIFYNSIDGAMIRQQAPQVSGLEFLVAPPGIPPSAAPPQIHPS